MIELTDKTKEREAVSLLNDYAVRLRAQGNFETARIVLMRAIALDNSYAELWSNLGCTLMSLGRHTEAQSAMERAAELKPENPDFWGNLCILYGSMKLYDKADEAYSKCVNLVEPGSPGDLGARWDRSLQLLERGQWSMAWEGYETRIERRGAQLYQKYPCPIWDGEDLNGKTLYIQAEQGIGDCLTFSRFIHEVHVRYPKAKIYFGCPDKLVNILWEYRNFVTFLPNKVPWPEEINYATYLCSLPKTLEITIDSLPADPGLILARCEKHPFDLPEPHIPSLKVGIAWTGNPKQDRNHERSIPLEMLMKLAENPHVCLYSLQVGPGEEDIVRLDAGEIIYPLGPVFEQDGIVAAGAAMLQMDIVLTVCTSTAHLAGALGVETLVMLCDDPYWMWERKGMNSRWHPSVTLYRQQRMGDWHSVLSDVEDYLDIRTEGLK